MKGSMLPWPSTTSSACLLVASSLLSGAALAQAPPPPAPVVPGAAPSAEPQPTPIPPSADPVQQPAPGTAPAPAPAAQPAAPAGQAPAPAGPPPPVTGYPSQTGTQPGAQPYYQPYPGQPPPPGYYGYYEPPPPPPPQADPNTVRTHDGFYMRLGMGLGYGRIHSEVLDLEATYKGSALAIDIMLGGTIANQVVVGGAIQTATLISPNFDGPSDSDDVGLAERSDSIGIGMIGIATDVFFGPTSGGHVGGVLGFANLDLETPMVDGNQDPVETSQGWGFSLFGGYDFWVSEQWAIGINARYTRVRGERMFEGPLGSELTVTDTGHFFGVMGSAVFN